MNIKNLVEGEWLELQPEDERIGALRLRVRPLSMDLAATELTGVPQMLALLEGLVMDWNLEADGVKIDCTPETRAAYLPSLYLLKVKDGGFVGNEALAFCQQIGNFLRP
jgi:hypothetical protein